MCISLDCLVLAAYIVEWPNCFQIGRSPVGLILNSSLFSHVSVNLSCKKGVSTIGTWLSKLSPDDQNLHTGWCLILDALTSLPRIRRVSPLV